MKNAKNLFNDKRAVSEENIQHLKEEATTMGRKIVLLEESKRKLLGDGLESYPIEEIQQVEDQLERSLTNIRKRKNQLFREKIEQLKEQDRILAKRNAELRKKLENLSHPLDLTRKLKEVPHRLVSDVETELFIGLPERRSSH
ncbi:hypothetical protein RJ640_027192 [Escallonia rubra]|uniref:K-box domain-containing protein n=1 Tax=Escallonia rubra TaxID=112253 RepID=A0AA88RGB0_9ASTE|nr:hypothetical protein RJ640_002390 [Escallonia rubra]KAK2989118.1 hypothetical protein RJ640_027192 [Escallonia rubra]